MDLDIGLYEEREQSYIKHRFLTKYLESAAFKTLQGHSPVFNFVDAFAGPWKISDEAKYSDASFDQAINTLEAVRVKLLEMGKSNIKIRFFFCEKRSNRFQKLKEYAEQKKSFDINLFQGAFEDNLDAISAAIPQGGFTFTFIDPTGWKIQNARIFDFLRKRKGEFLLNFMADHINRHAEYSKVVESFGQFLADPNWADEFAKTSSDLSNDERVLLLLKRKMLEAGVARFLPVFPIMVPRKERVKMRLILGTQSAHGLELFRDIQYKIEREEMEVRSGLRTPDDGQTSLFSDDFLAKIKQDDEGVGSKKYKLEATAIVMEELATFGSVVFKDIELKLMDAVPIRSTQIKELMNDLRGAGKIAYHLPPRMRKAQPDTIIKKGT
ncbi:three-Cys-motif partner protein TcmP [Aestuariivirga litoralis]|uniref:three-Cys-motif partner protein TcmP n=1 Tax=Aestuariivirga litoralis TaxID=2650924 RepID=UPI0018C525A9|nr:three-Cys-motif partner protein TcmP [Aestuariivirga litoralis]MBG1231160.1 three-Cys-motif partner protein TcmP [Aestuariivirga litoralis]